MPLSELSASAEVSHGGYRAPDRRPSQDAPAPPDPPAAASASAEGADAFPAEVAFYASRFRADLSQLGDPAAPRGSRPEASESPSDPALFDFFGNLSVLLLAVRSGDLARARAAADALEMEVLVERSAGRGEPAAPHKIDEFGRMLVVPLPRPTPPPAPPPARAEAAPPAPALTAAAPVAPPDPYAENGPDAGGAAYDTLAHFFDAETRV
jgi:hypothetical protein